jgi:hypothetical protein
MRRQLWEPLLVMAAALLTAVALVAALEALRAAL